MNLNQKLKIPYPLHINDFGVLTYESNKNFDGVLCRRNL